MLPPESSTMPNPLAALQDPMPPARCRIIHKELITRDDWLATLLDHIDRGGTIVAGSWIIKHHLTQGGTLPASLHERIVMLLAASDQWEAKLHILQCIDHLHITSGCRARVYPMIRALTEHRNAFVRAWALSGLDFLASHHPAYRVETDRLLAKAKATDSPAVCARLRQLPTRT